MDKQDLQATLRQLRDEVDRLGSGDPQKHAHLRQLIAEIERELANGGGAGKESIAEGLKTAIDHFEVEHPTLGALLNQLLLALSSMGI